MDARFRRQIKIVPTVGTIVGCRGCVVLGSYMPVRIQEMWGVSPCCGGGSSTKVVRAGGEGVGFFGGHSDGPVR